MRKNYEKSFIQGILDQYSGLGEILEYNLFTTGFENSNFYVRTNMGEFAVKIFEGLKLKPENVSFEVEVSDYAFKQGIKVPKIYANKKGNLETVFNDKHLIVMNYVSGENMHAKELTDSLVEQIAEETGKMDFAFKVFKDGSKTRQGYEFDLKNVLFLEKSLEYLSEEFDREILQSVFTDFKKIKSELDQLPKGLIHNDIVPHNCLVQDGKLNAIIDFSDIAFSPYIQNVAVSLHLIAFGYNWKPEQAGLFVKTYLKHNPLTEKELRLLYILIKARLLTFVLEFNRWNFVYAFDEQRAKTVKDHYEFLKRFIQFGEVEFNKLIA